MRDLTWSQVNCRRSRLRTSWRNLRGSVKWTSNGCIIRHHWNISIITISTKRRLCRNRKLRRPCFPRSSARRPSEGRTRRTSIPMRRSSEGVPWSPESNNISPQANRPSWKNTCHTCPSKKKSEKKWVTPVKPRKLQGLVAATITWSRQLGVKFRRTCAETSRSNCSRAEYWTQTRSALWMIICVTTTSTICSSRTWRVTFASSRPSSLLVNYRRRSAQVLLKRKKEGKKLRKISIWQSL